jgi:carbon-monoxide dehydrogenase medium subunit
MYETHYHRPKDLSEALSLFSSGADPAYLAGGHTLLPAMKQRLAAPSDVIDLRHLSELKGIEVTGETVSIGAGMTHAQVAAASEVREAIGALAALAGSIGDAQVRHLGTIGGSVANNDPAADYPAAVLALDGTVHTNNRSIPADDFFTGLYETALEPGEIVTRIDFKVPAAAGYAKFRNPASRYPMAAVFVARFRNEGVRVAVTGAGNGGVFRSSDMEDRLRSNFSADALRTINIDPAGMMSDIHASAEYRAHLVCVMARRAVENLGGASAII